MAITREQFEEIITDSIAKEFADIPMDGSSINHTFSDKYVRNMEKLVKDQRSLVWNMFNTAKKRVAVVAIAFLAFMAALCSVEEVRASLLRWCIEVHDGFTNYFFEGETTKKIEREYVITEVPEGFELTGKVDDDQQRIYIYRNNEKDDIMYSQKTTEELQGSRDNEHGVEYTKIIRDIEVVIYESESRNSICAMWIEDGYYMSILYRGCVDAEAIKCMIESIE